MSDILKGTDETPVLKAGAVIVSNAHPRQVLLLHQEKHNDISFPKGHLEAGETLAQCAVREVKEETGLDIKLLEELPTVHYRNHKDGAIETHYYLAVVKSTPASAPEKGASILWVPIEEVEARLSYDNLRELFAAAKPKIEALD